MVASILIENEENEVVSEEWFPKRIKELDEMAHRAKIGGIDLDSDHPGFTDPVYVARRRLFSEISFNYRHGQPIPEVSYTDIENKTWNIVYSELKKLYPKYACKEYLENLPLFENECGYADGKVPQLQVVNDFLTERTGFSLRPVAGFLPARDFLAMLAFRVFCCTQYIRHSSDPFYTPEPDVCHELLGHVPMLADQGYADFSQEIGLASLGASDEDIEALGKVYVFTIEFGLIRQHGEVRAVGAGLLSCVSEFKHAMEFVEHQQKFVIEEVLKTPFHVTSFQEQYFVEESFEKSKSELKKFAASIKRGFFLKYNAKNRSIIVLRTKEDFMKALDDAKEEVRDLSENMERLLGT